MNDPLQRLSDIERQQRNTFLNAKVASFDAESHTVTIKIDFNGDTLESEAMPLIGRSRIDIDDDVLVILPTATPAVGYVIGLSPDPELTRLSNRVNELQQQIAQLQ